MYSSRGAGQKRNVFIACENLSDNLGFDISTQIKFKNTEDRLDYTELFCSDRFAECPYFKAMMAIKYTGK